MARLVTSICVAVLLAGCAEDPLQGVERLSDTEISESQIQAAIREEPSVDTAEPPKQRGLLGGLFASPAEVEEPAELPVDVAEADAPEALEPIAVPEKSAAPQGGLLGFLRQAADDGRSQDTGAPTEVASLAPAATVPVAPSIRSDAPDAALVSLGTTLPFGSLARVCDVRPNQMGQRVERYPEKRGTYTLYDSEPGNTAPHTFYVTGFKDGCARQFTAALAIFGSTTTHEQLRYGLPAQVQPFSKTDAAYEKLKSRICRVGKGKPCGSALPKMARSTVFVSIYENFGSNAKWKTILIHNGEVIESDIRGNG